MDEKWVQESRLVRTRDWKISLLGQHSARLGTIFGQKRKTGFQASVSTTVAWNSSWLMIPLDWKQDSRRKFNERGRINGYGFWPREALGRSDYELGVQRTRVATAAERARRGLG